MKKVMFFVLMMAFTSQAFAGGYDPCRSLAYQYCANQLKTLSPTPGPHGEQYCTVNPTTAEFKACEVTARTTCKNNGYLDLTPKPCF